MPPKSKPKTRTTSSDEQDDYISLSIVKQSMAQQESAFKSMVESLMKATTLRVDNLVKEVAELKYSLEYSQKDIASQSRNRIPEKRNETWEESEVMLKAALTENLGLAQEPLIERAHHVGKPTQIHGSARKTPRHIVCRLYDWKEKQSIFKQARIIKPSRCRRSYNGKAKGTDA
ncbi:Hypothetical predicted protein [Paramuricea clavata]|uniref:Uncharacterized protein n=1 Tax=Paramuricea clavata TaxID=317549 RepID=A0A7D9HF18_PARCT|nr:Hypothetical predicted protein [Paramuricea clavata]